jgi:hypothetical protein
MSPDPKVKTREEIRLDRLRTGTGLAALIVTIVAVVVLAVVTAILLGGGVNSDSTVAIVTAAFGIISTVATAFFGIRATANSSVQAAAASASGSEADAAAELALHEVEVERQTSDRLEEEIDNQEEQKQIEPAVAKALRDVRRQAEKEARRARPQQGGESG